jgi:hypothetical protein
MKEVQGGRRRRRRMARRQQVEGKTETIFL